MTIAAVQTKVRSYVNGLTVPGYTSPVQAYIKVPVPGFGKVGQLLVFIWGGVGHESRTAIPRGQGWKGTEHAIGLWILGFEEANTDVTSHFPTAIEVIANALRTATPMPIQLTDVDTGRQSQLMNLGEEISWEYDIDRSLADQRLVRNLCRMEASALEEFNA